jgi:hypothetical protein
LKTPESSGKEVLKQVIIKNHEFSASEILEEIKSKTISPEVNPDDLVLAVLRAD